MFRTVLKRLFHEFQNNTDTEAVINKRARVVKNRSLARVGKFIELLLRLRKPIFLSACCDLVKGKQILLFLSAGFPDGTRKNGEEKVLRIWNDAMRRFLTYQHESWSWTLVKILDFWFKIVLSNNANQSHFPCFLHDLSATFQVSLWLIIKPSENFRMYFSRFSHRNRCKKEKKSH